MTFEAWWLLVTVAACGVAVELATRALARVHPPSYFGISELIRGFNRDTSPFGFVVRLALPFVAGALAGLLNPEDSAAAGAAASGFGALLTVWPPLVHDHLLPDAAWGRKTEVRVIYVLYFAAFVLLGLAGGTLGGYGAEFVPGPVANWLSMTEVPSSTQVLGSVMGGIVGSVALGVVWRLLSRFRHPAE